LKARVLAGLSLYILASLVLMGCQPQQFRSHGNPALKATSQPISSVLPRMATSTSLPQATATPTPVCTEDKGQLVEGSYHGKVYGQEIPYLAYLPPCYSDGNELFPVMYLLHGYPFDQTHWLNLGLVEAYERGLTRGLWPRVIFILPFAPDPLFTRSDGGVGSYEQEFLEGLVPVIEARYRVQQNADQRVLGGVSRGGVWALEIGLRHADQFNHIGAVSPALVYNQPRPRYDPFEIVREERPFPNTLFLSAAENETPFREEIEAFLNALEGQSIDYTFLLHPGTHNDESWRAVIEDILAQLLLGLSS
jgi:enterochelin esterase-like enzyme